MPQLTGHAFEAYAQTKIVHALQVVSVLNFLVRPVNTSAYLSRFLGMCIVLSIKPKNMYALLLSLGPCR